MIQVEQIRIGSTLHTNNGEIIDVESISAKRRNRKIGYHREGEPYRLRYVRISQCELVEIEITTKLLEANGWEIRNFPDSSIPNFAYLRKGNWYAQYKFGRCQLDIWTDWDDVYQDVVVSDIHVRICQTAEKLSKAFELADINYKLKMDK